MKKLLFYCIYYLKNLKNCTLYANHILNLYRICCCFNEFLETHVNEIETEISKSYFYKMC